MTGQRRGGDDDDSQARRRLQGYYLAAAQLAADLINPEVRRFTPVNPMPPVDLPALSTRTEALEWFEQEHDALIDVAMSGDDWQLLAVLRPWFEQRGHFADWQRTADRALELAGDDHAQANVRLSLGGLAGWQQDRPSSDRQFRQVVRIAGPWPELAAAALTTLT